MQADPFQRDFFIDNLLVRIHFIIVVIRWTGLAPWEFDPFHLSVVPSSSLAPLHTLDFEPFIKSQLTQTKITLVPYVVYIFGHVPRGFQGSRDIRSPPFCETDRGHCLIVGHTLRSVLDLVTLLMLSAWVT